MTTEEFIVYILAPLVAYLLGSIPFAWVIGKAKGVDIRTVGSKNIGATNLGRTFGKKYFWQAFLLDAAKGFIPTLLIALYIRHVNEAAQIASFHAARIEAFTTTTITAHPPLQLPSWSPLLTAIAAVLGHLFPIYLKFKGGKGVAVGFGCVLGFWPAYTLSGFVGGFTFVVVLMLFRYISLSSIVGSIAFAITASALVTWNNPYVDTYLSPNNRLPLILVAWLFSTMIILRHRTNIARLLKGTEPKVSDREINRSKMP